MKKERRKRDVSKPILNKYSRAVAREIGITGPDLMAFEWFLLWWASAKNLKTRIMASGHLSIWACKYYIQDELELTVEQERTWFKKFARWGLLQTTADGKHITDNLGRGKGNRVWVVPNAELLNRLILLDRWPPRTRKLVGDFLASLPVVKAVVSDKKATRPICGNKPIMDKNVAVTSDGDIVLIIDEGTFSDTCRAGYLFGQGYNIEEECESCSDRESCKKAYDVIHRVKEVAKLKGSKLKEERK